jgi:hypothetical protein
VDLHVPEGPIRSAKDFLIHIVIVTIGILIALGLEQLVEMHHRHRLADEAVAGFRRELADDRKAMDEVMEAMPRLQTDIDAEIANLEGPAPREIRYPGFTYNVISTASWETAVATQALAELPYEEAHKFAEAYAAFRLFEEIERRGLSSWQEMRLYSRDPAKLNADQRRALIEKLRLYQNITYVIEPLAKGVAASNEALQQK